MELHPPFSGPALSVVLPIHNEEDVLPALFERLTRAFEKLGESYEIVFVDDGSRDGSRALLKGFHVRDPRVKIVSFSNNFGHQNAVTAGLHNASGQAVVVMDGDLQDPPELVPVFVEKWKAGHDVVFGIRTKRKEGLLKRACYWMYYRILKRVAHIDIPPDSGDFCLMSRRVVDLLNSLKERNRFIRGLRSWAGFPQIGIPYERDARYAGTSKYGYLRLFNLGMDGIVSFSGTPLRASIALGLVISLSSMLYAAYIALDRIFRFHPPEDRVPGWATLVVAVTFLGGIQLVVMGLVGEYILRIYDEVKERPHYVVEERIGFEPSHAPDLRRHPGV